MASKNLYSFKCKKLLEKGKFDLSAYKGKVVLIENTATLWGTTVRDFTQMNEICEKYGDKVAVLSFPSNQFGHQENSDGIEILNALKYVRPGNGYEPKMELFDKIDVNGENEHELFTWLKENLPAPDDDCLHLMDDPKYLIWAPVKRNDITWNFEKFLLDKEGKPIKRYSAKFETKDVQKDIDKLL